MPKYEKDVVSWITVNGNHIPIKPGQTAKEAIAERFDDTDDVEIDVETEDLDKEAPYDTIYYTHFGPFEQLVKKEDIDKVAANGYTIHEMEITAEMQDLMNEYLNSKYIDENNIRGLMYEFREKTRFINIQTGTRKLFNEYFRRLAIDKCAEKADEFLDKLPKNTRIGSSECAKDTNSVGYKESIAAKYNSKEYDYYTSNCQRCIIAWEMRKRGYDVEANKYTGRTDQIYNETLSLTRAFLDYDNMTRTKYYDKMPDGSKYPSRGALIHAMERDMLKEGEGARFAVAWRWKNSSWGHTINAEVSNGEVIFYDAQTGNSHTIKDLINRKDLRATTLRTDRIDNLKLSNRLEDLVKWKK